MYRYRKKSKEKVKKKKKWPSNKCSKDLFQEGNES